MNIARAITLPIVFATLFGTFCVADEISDDDALPLIRPANDSDLSEFLWEKRPLVVFADSENDPAFIAQMDLLNQDLDALKARDVIVLTDTNSAELSAIRKKLRPRGFMLVILSKEGRVQLRKPFPWDVREISRTIDKLPIRQREIRAEKTAGASSG